MNPPDEPKRNSTGSIEVICGSMFSGKSEELIRRLRRAQIAKQKVTIFKPRIDNRFSKNEIVSHSEQRITSTVVDTADEILLLGSDSDVIGIDEAQFFNEGLVDVCQKLAENGIRVIVAGLDTDYRAKPFEPIPQLLAVAEYITKTLAVCVKCGAAANRTQRIINDSSRVIVGASDVYEARCRKCYESPKD